jgi:hypothetical protein
MFRGFARIRHRQPEAPKEVERGHVRHEPLPVARAILWKPLPDSYHLLASMMRTAEQQTQLFVTQRAFLQVDRHLGSAPDLELGGFLAGHLCECPRSRARYSVVNTVIPFADVTGEPLGARVTHKAYETVRRRLDTHRLALIGWYRNGSGLGLQLLPDDVETHLAYFNEPWQTTMLVVPDASKPKGAFFTYDPRVGRGYCVPFYELFAGDAADSNRLGRTCVTWTTYIPSNPVQPLAVGDREIVETTVMPIRHEPEPQPTEPIDEWLEAIKDPWVKLKDVAVHTRRRDEPAPLVWESADHGPQATPKELEPKFSVASIQERRAPDELDVTPRQVVAAERTEPPQPPAAVEQIETSRRTVAAQRVEAPSPPPAASPMEAPQPPIAPKRIEAAPLAPVAQRIEIPRSEPARPAPPFAGPARPAARAPTAPRTEPAGRARKRQPPHEAPAAPPPAAPRSQPEPRRAPPPPRAIPPATVEAMLREVVAPAVALPPDFHEGVIRWQRRRRIGFAVAAASFLAVIALSTIRARTSGSAQAQPAAPAAAPTPPTQSPAQLTASINGDVVLALPVAVDSLSGALSYYRAIEADHRGGMVGCRVLDRAYQLVGHARTRVDSARSRVAGALDAADSIRVSMLRAEYTHVAQTYRRSGCAS